ncbi:hypothetical protein EV424DRAFT_1407554 [Suillus variegatus]|nr:hypothetical protein EV424DRAFT_1407554 [Suillus variegatus]
MARAHCICKSSLLLSSSVLQAVLYNRYCEIENTAHSAGYSWTLFWVSQNTGTKDPFKSALLMRDQPLTLLDIAQTDLSRPELTLLSACETAVSNHQTPGRGDASSG